MRVVGDEKDREIERKLEEKWEETVRRGGGGGGGKVRGEEGRKLRRGRMGSQ